MQKGSLAESEVGPLWGWRMAAPHQKPGFAGLHIINSPASDKKVQFQNVSILFSAQVERTRVENTICFPLLGGWEAGGKNKKTTQMGLIWRTFHLHKIKASKTSIFNLTYELLKTFLTPEHKTKAATAS